MTAYVYQAELHCEECAQKIRAELDAQGRKPYSYDSDDYPKGPYPDGGGEADTPQHCATCGTFLENPLTSDGYAYVQECDSFGGRVASMWREFYGVQS